jgi:hypothetical protein
MRYCNQQKINVGPAKSELAIFPDGIVHTRSYFLGSSRSVFHFTPMIALALLFAFGVQEEGAIEKAWKVIRS